MAVLIYFEIKISVYFKDSDYSLYLCILDGKREIVRMKMQKIDAMFIGTGDLFAAL